MKNIIVLALISLILQGCASVSITPPIQNGFSNSRTYDEGFEKTWSASVDWFADHDVSIDKIQKESGLLTAKYLIAVDGEELDCGVIKAQSVPYLTVVKQGSFNATIRPKSSSQTVVSVNFFGTFDLTGRDGNRMVIISESGRCVSTGKIEAAVLDFIEEKLRE